MQEKVQITCIACPRGCRTKLTVGDGEVIDVEGAECKRGRKYVIQEFKHPVRVLTSTVKIEGGGYLSVRTRGEVPKERIFDIMAMLREVKCRPPVEFEQVICENILDTGVNIVATSACSGDAKKSA